tara:strand:+ start:205 stop:870 length:666 start_codon:yes stop_codon:yes gene_type:complete
MTTIKYLIFKNFKTVSILTLCCLVSLFLLMVRLKITHSFFLLFLVWNLFLAMLPFCISFYLQQQENLKKWQLLGWSFLWLLFLPNAPYIVTDLIHLKLNDGLIVLVDFVVITSFAIAGLLFYLTSVRDMEVLFQRNFSKKLKTIFFTMLPFLCGFGIYLGRFLRFNSWDIIQDPASLVVTVAKIIIFPASNWFAWAVTLGFGFFLWILIKGYKKCSTLKKS